MNDYGQCSYCPHGTCYRAIENYIVCNYSKGSKKYKAFWYLTDSIFRLYDDYTNFNLIVELKEGFESITPQNIVAKTAVLVLFS